MGGVASARASSTSRARPVGMASTRSCGHGADPDALEEGIGLGRRVGLAVVGPGPADLRRGEDVLAGGERPEHLEPLEGPGDPRRARTCALAPVMSSPVEEDLPADGLLQPGDHVEGGRLARPRWARSAR